MSEAAHAMHQPDGRRRAPRRAGAAASLRRRSRNSRELTLFVLMVAARGGDERSSTRTISRPRPNLRAVLLNLAPIGILVCGMMLLMIAGTFDLSVGSTLALAGVWAGRRGRLVALAGAGRAPGRPRRRQRSPASSTA